jgi:hypothetical protein
MIELFFIICLIGLVVLFFGPFDLKVEEDDV